MPTAALPVCSICWCTVNKSQDSVLIFCSLGHFVVFGSVNYQTFEDYCDDTKTIVSYCLHKSLELFCSWYCDFFILFLGVMQYTGMMLLEEMASIFLTPLLLLFVVPKRVDDILQFIADYTVDVEGVGHVCSFSTFDFQNHGNSNYGSPYHTPRTQRSSQGKMEKSFLSFQSSYPSWEPNAQGKQFLLNLRSFRERKVRGQGNRHAYSSPRLWRGSPSLRVHGERNSSLSREWPYNAHGTGYQLGSLWLIDEEPRNHPYLLDWYYTSQHQQTAGHTRTHTHTLDIPPGPFDVTEQQPVDFWMPTQNEARYDQFWDHNYGDRSETHLEASTSAPFFRESVLQHHDSNNLAQPTRSHWWARTSPHDAQPQSSFLEPPDFNHYTAQTNVHDNLSERSLEEQEQFLYWRNSHKLSRTSYIDDLEAGSGDVNLHFDDIYNGKPPETPRVNLEPPRL